MAKYFKVLRYLVAGGTATVVNLATVYLLTDRLGVYYLVSSIVAFILAIVISFILQKFWTFEDYSRHAIHRQAFVFILVALLGLVLNTFLVYGLVEYLRQHYLAAQILSGVAIAVCNFFVYQNLIFRYSSEYGATD